MMHFDTDQLAPADRVERWREEFARSIVATEWSAIADAVRPFRVAMRLRDGHKLSIMRSEMDAVATCRDRKLLCDGADDATLMMCTRGAVSYRHNGRTGTISRGEIALFTHNLPIEIAWDSATLLTLQIPRATLEPTISPELFAGQTCSGLPVLLLGSYAAASLASGLSPLAERHLIELAADALGNCEARPSPRRLAAQRRARIVRIRNAIAAMATNFGVQANDVGAKLGISGRTVQRDLASVGLCFGNELTAMRLAAACNLLRCDDLTIATAAFDAGFADLSHFNRMFRAAYGMAPSQWRESIRAAAPKLGSFAP